MRYLFLVLHVSPDLSKLIRQAIDIRVHVNKHLKYKAWPATGTISTADALTVIIIDSLTPETLKATCTYVCMPTKEEDFTIINARIIAIQ